MIICLDSGNSRIKWGVHDGSSWLGQGALAHADIGELAGLLERWPNPRRVMLANVAGAEAAERIRVTLAPWREVLVEARPAAEALGVRNGYENPAQLGIDRWCALIGARSLHPGPALVVMAGTATTIDTLTADGLFAGGLILPGLDMMRHSLGRGTADLPIARGQPQAWPRCTDDAIVSGVIDAQVGAIERAWSRLQGEGKCCLISGGSAGELLPHLSMQVQPVDNLPMLGLLELARIGT